MLWLTINGNQRLVILPPTLTVEVLFSESLGARIRKQTRPDPLGFMTCSKSCWPFSRSRWATGKPCAPVRCAHLHSNYGKVSQLTPAAKWVFPLCLFRDCHETLNGGICWRWLHGTKPGTGGYMSPKEKGFAITFITPNPYIHWCRRDESNTRPSHYE